MCVTSIDSNGNINGYGFDDSDWQGDTRNCLEHYGNSCGYELATDQEVETALIKEAKKRGFKEGVTIKCLNNNFHNTYKLKSTFNDLYIEDGDLWFGTEEIFINGKWAEIIEDNPE